MPLDLKMVILQEIVDVLHLNACMDTSEHKYYTFLDPEGSLSATTVVLLDGVVTRFR